MKKSDEVRVRKLFNGSAKVKPVRDARRIAETVGVSRREVMEFLEREGLRRYSAGSYN